MKQNQRESSHHKTKLSRLTA
jgi:hypothetical protein